MADEEKEYHYTCTSSNLPGKDKEHLDTEVLDKIFEKLFGIPVSNDPLARGQREQAITRYKRQKTSWKDLLRGQ